MNNKTYWSEEEKRSVCEEALSSPESIAQVARRNGLNKGRLYNWLKDKRYNPSPKPAIDTPVSTAFVPVSVENATAFEKSAPECSPNFTTSTSELVMEIRLIAGHEVRLSGCLSEQQLTAVLAGLTT
ncbi:IS66-like element accessory protein TnpA [Flexibacterium corallicola]|uniref:IS66-like element accessory protein TnpA n=1 Tax=Flexibacterium corallicola TaxID=3037259 RepID=UPI00286F21A1|nr:transposase [Pseudovibrio sp. M1P-2-3]